MTLTAADRLIVALDGNDPEPLGQLAWQLNQKAGITFFKIGVSTLLDTRGSLLITELQNLAVGPISIMLDLKLYDTRDTVATTVRRAFDLGTRFVTVHATPSVMEAAMRAKPLSDRCKVLAVPTLSDQPVIESKTLFDSTNAAKMAAQVCDGIVWPAWRLGELRQARSMTLGPGFERLVICPGIRTPRDYAKDDNHFAWLTPTEALRAGADYLVVGRPITFAPDPVAAARAVLAEMEII